MSSPHQVLLTGSQLGQLLQQARKAPFSQPRASANDDRRR